MNLLDSKKQFANAVREALILQGGREEVRKLEKLVFLAELFALRDSDTALTSMSYVAAEFGPVPAVDGAVLDVPQLLSELFEDIEVVDGVATTTATATETRPALRRSQSVYGEETFDELSRITHGFPAYFMTARGQVIDPELMKIAYRFGPIERSS